MRILSKIKKVLTNVSTFFWKENFLPKDGRIKPSENGIPFKQILEQACSAAELDSIEQVLEPAYVVVELDSTERALLQPHLVGGSDSTSLIFDYK